MSHKVDHVFALLERNHALTNEVMNLNILIPATEGGMLFNQHATEGFKYNSYKHNLCSLNIIFIKQK